MNQTKLDALDEELLRRAIDAAERLYIKDIQEVGSALRTSAGDIFTAIHFETSTGFATICGEVAAIC